MFFPIPPAFDYVQMALDWFWPGVVACAATDIAKPERLEINQD
jgi:hypothetical protein